MTPAAPDWRARFGRILPPRWQTPAAQLIVLALLAALLAATTDVATGSGVAVILIAFLTAVTVNFSLPAAGAAHGLTPLVTVVALLALGWQPALVAAVAGQLLAELLRPLWRPLWRDTPLAHLSGARRLGLALVHIAAASGGAALLAAPPGGRSLLLRGVAALGLPVNAALLAPLVVVSWVLLVLLAAWLAYGRLAGPTVTAALRGGGTQLLVVAALAYPLALFVVSADFTIPAFVVVCTAVGAFAVSSWLSWQRRFLVERQYDQFVRLNAVGATLRQSLDLDSVLAHIHEQVAALVPADQVTITLRDADGGWRRPRPINRPGDPPPGAEPTAPDDFTRWVAEHRRVLEVDRDSLHYAARHDLTPPQPPPAFWLGIPLIAADRLVGVMVFQSWQAGEPLSRWRRELLLAIAGQASAAVENARLYSETLRLYNLTDEALSRRLEQLQALLDSVQEAILMLDRRGRVLLLNPPAAALLQQSAGALQGAPLAAERAAALGYTPDGWRALLDELAAGQRRRPERAVYAWPSGERRRYIERDEVPVLSDDGARLMGWLLVLRDVTEERERSEWRADLMRMIVHDLRNPISTLVSTVELLQRRVPDDNRPAVDDLLQTARRNCATLLEMVDSLMDINRAEAGRFAIDAEAMRLTTLADRVVDYLMPVALQRGVALAFNYPDDLPYIWGDEVILRRVLLNLLDNALKFTPAGGSVRGTLAVDGAAAPGDREPGVRVTITDDGPGIPADERALIFERFVTFNRGGGQVRGTGLGLTFCKLAVEAHGGRIWVEDAPGGGSRFVFTLPGMPF